MSLLCAALVLFIWGLLVVGALHEGNRFRLPVAGPDDLPSGDAPGISIVLPARNEAHQIAFCVDSLRRQTLAPNEIVILDDCSTDGTASVVRQLEKRGVPVRLVEGTEPPAGWIGKNHAIVQAMNHARGSWVLFTDADTRHAPETLASAYTYALRTRSALVSLTGHQEAKGVWEKIIQPLVFRLLDAIYPLSGANGGDPKRAAANGTYMLVRRDAYDAVGGHAAVRGEVLEDVAIAQAIVGAGYRASFLRGEHLLRVRMYQSSGSLWEGWTKNLWPLLGRNGRRTAMVTAAVLMAGAIPAAMLWYDGAAAWAAAAGAVGAEAWFRARGGSGPAWAISLPLGALLLAAMIVESARRHLSSRGISWKGRTYPLLP